MATASTPWDCKAPAHVGAGQAIRHPSRLAASDETGQPTFVQIPLWMMRDGALSQSAKLTYGRLKLYAGANGRCFPKHETLAREVCLSPRRLRDVLTELRCAGLVEWTRTRSSCVFTFPDRQKAASLSGGKRPTRPEENRRSRSAEKCQQKRSIENHHQKRRIEKKTERNSAKTNPLATPEERRKPDFDSLRVDDEKPKDEHRPAVCVSPEEELRAIYREKAGVEISLDVERRIWEELERRDVRRADFIEELRKHVQNAWRNPAGFLTDFARKFGTVSTPEPRTLAAPEPVRNSQGRCVACNGIGRDGDSYCSCPLGRDLRLAETRNVARETAEGTNY